MNDGRYSVKRNPGNLPYAPARWGDTDNNTTYLAGAQVGGRRCPACREGITASSRIIALDHGWTHEGCAKALAEPAWRWTVSAAGDSTPTGTEPSEHPMPFRLDVPEHESPSGTFLHRLSGDVPDVPKVPHTPRASPKGAAVLDTIEAFLRSYCALPSDHAATAVVLWVAHVHALDAFESTPRLAVLSPEMGSGKTRVLEVIQHLVTGSEGVMITPTAATLFRLIGDGPEDREEPLPTLLLDEADAVFLGRPDSNTEAIRAILNSGYRRGATVPRMDTSKKVMKLQRFSVFAPVAIAGIGNLPETVMSRSIVIRMKRRRPDENVKPYRDRVARAEGAALHAALSAWGAPLGTSLLGTYPSLPSEVGDRDADCWEPLIAIADAAGADWPERSRRAAVAFVTEATETPRSIGTRLLADVRTVMGGREKISTFELLTSLCSMESAPWPDLGGTGLDARFLAKTLEPYGVKVVKIRLDDYTTRQGYRLDEGLHDAFVRYLPVPAGRAEHPEQPRDSGAGMFRTNGDVPEHEGDGCAVCIVCGQTLLHPSSFETCVCARRDDAHMKAREAA